MINAFLIALLSMAISGCSALGYIQKEDCPKTYVDREVIAKVPVKCTPKPTFCTAEGSVKSDKVEVLLECIAVLRESNKSCE